MHPFAFSIATLKPSLYQGSNKHLVIFVEPSNLARCFLIITMSPVPKLRKRTIERTWTICELGSEAKQKEE